MKPLAIEPTDPNAVYVPYYDPGVVYGGWPYPDYPPYYWPAPAYIGAGLLVSVSQLSYSVFRLWRHAGLSA